MTKPKLTPAKLRDQIDEYFKSLPDGVFPDYAGMLIELGLFPDDVSALCGGEDVRSMEFRKVFMYAELRRESWLSRIAASDSKLSSGAFNLLKQGKNGGYTSASQPTKGNTIRLIVDGVGGMEAFK